MSTIYFQYTEGQKSSGDDQKKKDDAINEYLHVLRDQKIMYPTHVKIENKNTNDTTNDTTKTFKDYLQTLSLKQIPNQKPDKVAGIKNWYKDKFKEKHEGLMKTLGSDFEKVREYIKKKNDYDSQKEKRKDFENEQEISINIECKIIKINEKYELIDKSTNKSISINHDDETITFKYDKTYELKKTIDTLILLDNNIMEPKQPKLDLLKVVNYDEFNEDKILYNFSQKNDWSLDPSELYKDLNPNK